METLRTLLLVICSVHTITKSAVSSKRNAKKGTHLNSTAHVDTSRNMRDEELGNELLQRTLNSAFMKVRAHFAERRKREMLDFIYKRTSKKDLSSSTTSTITRDHQFVDEQNYHLLMPPHTYNIKHNFYGLDIDRIGNNKLLSRSVKHGYTGTRNLNTVDNNIELTRSIPHETYKTEQNVLPYELPELHRTDTPKGLLDEPDGEGITGHSNGMEVSGGRKSCCVKGYQSKCCPNEERHRISGHVGFTHGCCKKGYHSVCCPRDENAVKNEGNMDNTETSYEANGHSCCKKAFMNQCCVDTKFHVLHMEPHIEKLMEEARRLDVESDVLRAKAKHLHAPHSILYSNDGSSNDRKDVIQTDNAINHEYTERYGESTTGEGRLITTDQDSLKTKKDTHKKSDKHYISDGSTTEDHCYDSSAKSINLIRNKSGSVEHSNSSSYQSKEKKSDESLKSSKSNGNVPSISEKYEDCDHKDVSSVVSPNKGTGDLMYHVSSTPYEMFGCNPNSLLTSPGTNQTSKEDYPCVEVPTRYKVSHGEANPPFSSHEASTNIVPTRSRQYASSPMHKPSVATLTSGFSPPPQLAPPRQLHQSTSKRLNVGKEKNSRRKSKKQNLHHNHHKKYIKIKIKNKIMKLKIINYKYVKEKKKKKKSQKNYYIGTKKMMSKPQSSHHALPPRTDGTKRLRHSQDSVDKERNKVKEEKHRQNETLIRIKRGIVTTTEDLAVHRIQRALPPTTGRHRDNVNTKRNTVNNTTRHNNADYLKRPLRHNSDPHDNNIQAGLILKDQTYTRRLHSDVNGFIKVRIKPLHKHNNRKKRSTRNEKSTRKRERRKKNN